jgi:hypothetical protein
MNNNENTINEIPANIETPYDWVGVNTPNDLSTEADERAALNTFAAEPAVEQEPEPQPYDGCEGQWAGDGSGFDDLADLGEQEGHDW